MYSFIFPSNDYSKAARLVADINKKFPDAEVKPVFEAKSFFDAWRKGLAETSGDLVILTHHDVKFIELPDFDDYFDGRVGMVGVAGAKEITKEAPWWFDEKRLAEGKLSGRIFHGNDESVYGPYGEVVVLDGSCLVTRREILEEVGIPELGGVNWHFYDHVMSLEFIKAGYKLRTAPIKMSHESKGEKGEEFVKSLGVFMREYL